MLENLYKCMKKWQQCNISEQQNVALLLCAEKHTEWEQEPIRTFIDSKLTVSR